MENYLTVEEAHRLIAKYITDNPSATYQDVGTHFGYSQANISVISRKLGLPSRAAGKRKSRVPKAGCNDTRV